MRGGRRRWPAATSRRRSASPTSCLARWRRRVPDRVPAASQGTMNNVTLGGADPRTGRRFAYYETMGGGMGGRDGTAGPVRRAHAHEQHAQHAGRGDRARSAACASGSTALRQGQRRRRRVPRRRRARARVRAAHGRVRDGAVRAPDAVAPYGAQGGEPGGSGRNTLIRDGREEPLPGKIELHAPSRAIACGSKRPAAAVTESDVMTVSGETRHRRRGAR